MTEKQFVTHSPKETMALAERFAALLRPGDVVAYEGGMGAGKTVFTRGVARFFGVEDEVASPTFALVNEYGQDPVLAHFDLWRITDEDDLYSTGFFDYLDTDSVLVIEWSENIDGALPENTIRIDMQKGETETERVITIDGIEL